VETCLAGRRPIAEAFLRLEGYDRLMLLGAGAIVPASSELLASARTREIVRDLKSRYADRIVIFDLPPVLGGDDAVAFAPQVDAVLLVIGEGHTRVDDVLRTFELLRDKPVIGTVLNQSRTDTTAAYAY
jgi:Mrp family chromosome partitioning ATPase